MNIDFEAYKTHPRVLEVRFILLYEMFEREFGRISALKWYEIICEYFKCDYTKILAIINKRFEIKRYQKTKLTRWRQQVIFAATCYEESIYKVAKDYLILSPQNIYTNELLDMNNFLNDEWLRELDEDATLCGMPSFRIEVERFFEAIDGVINVLKRWKGYRNLE